MRERLARILDRIWYGRSPAAWFLLPLSWIYVAAFAVDRSLHSRQRRVRSGLPVIVVGNLSVGGTGKTPLVIWLARALVDRGFSPGIVSRGYRGRGVRSPRQVAPDDDPSEVGDEPVLLARSSGCPVVVCPDRGAAVEALARSAAVDVVLADDGLQHHGLARDCEIAVVDGNRGLGNGLCLPAGPLREPARRLTEVDAVVVNGRGGWSRVGAIVGELEVTGVERLDGSESRGIDSFRGQHVHAFAAIGNPQRFFDLLARHGLIVKGHAKADHSQILPSELQAVGGSTVMLTEKDAVKLERKMPGNVWCVKVDYAFEQRDAERLMTIILNTLSMVANT